MHVHASFAMLALVVAPIQFFTRVRVTHPAMHRALGRTYVFSIMVSAPIAIYIAVSQMHDNEKLAVAAQGLLWMSTTAIAVYCAINKNVGMHKAWITRSYALTLSFVISRLFIDVLHLQISPEIGGSAGMVWLITLVVLMVADVTTMT